MVRVGIVGTSWWSDAMYLPALAAHPLAEVVSVAGRNVERAHKFAERWHIPHVYTDWRELIAAGGIDCLIVASSNDTHYPITMAALDAGLHVLCEKPLALTGPEARAMANKAREVGVKTMTPFTYRYMPTTRYVKQLIDDGYIGRPYHLNMRYYTGYGRDTDYMWRFDSEVAGAGVIGDLGSHWLYLARWFFGEITGVTCYSDALIKRDARPDGSDYTQTEDTAVMTVKFENGAYGVLQVTTLAWEGTSFGQTHHQEFHGSEGTLYSFIDWNHTQEVRGLQAGQEGGARILAVPDEIWGNVRRESVHDTYRDIFRNEDNMTREFITAIAEDKPVEGPTFEDGARIQELIDAALKSAANNNCFVET
ncbi:MAG: oxidoreductase [Phototrophicales bacterium]|nr:MAG: oxidoreductase [Phototrophicales bacterium]